MRRSLADLPLAEQVALLSGSTFWASKSNEAAGVAAFVMSDGPHGLRRQDGGSDHLGVGDSLPATCFPPAVTLGSTWDVDLIEEVGDALGREAVAARVGVVLGPGLNLKRHPAGGRNFEYLSEDPLLAGRLAAAMIRGIQSNGVAACPKHFVANNHESYRMVCDAVIDERTLRELYLRGFEIAVTDGEPWSLMTAYNLVNGTYMSDHERLLRDVLRNEWGFDGMVVTDWGGLNDKVAAARAGNDLEMPSSGGSFDAALIDAVESGDVASDLLLDRVESVARLADRVASVVASERTDVDEVGHHRLARRAAAAGTVLLTNDGTLPLDPTTDVAILGAFAETPRYQGAGSSQVVPTRLDDARRHLADQLTGNVRYLPVYDPETGDASADDIRRAAEVARDVDVPVVFVGLPRSVESEGRDRSHLALPPAHDALVTAVCAANPRTVVVLSNGSPVLMPWADRSAAILEGYLGGQAGGAAIADVLTGRDEPGGRLAESFPASMVFPAEQNFAGGKRQVQYREGLYVGYRFHDSAEVAPRFAFGHGGSYTTFEWSAASVSGSGCDLTVEVTVTNTGERTGSEVVQVYVHDVESTVYRPRRELRGFTKAHLAPGASEVVTVALDERAFAFFDVDDERWRVEAGEFDLLVSASSIDVRDTIRVDIPGDTITAPPSGADGPGRRRFVASDAEFTAMLGHPIPEPVPVLPFTTNTVVDELDATRLGRGVKRLIRSIADRQRSKMLGSDPDPVVEDLTKRMVDEAPLRLLVAMSGGSGSLAAFDGLTKALSALRLGR